MTTLRRKVFKFVGGRILKTGLAAFITAWICAILDWPALFAVMTAIVTIEPTAADSIKKGIIRFPAAAIGAGFAMLFEAFLHQEPITYALAAMFTLIACHRLHLDAGMLVATLTAVAMIPGTEAHFMESFFIRLGTTMTGIVVSTAVNFFILPPKFNPMITESVDRLYETAGSLVADVTNINMHKQKQVVAYQRLSKSLERTYQLINYQREEWKYRRHSINEIRSFNMLLKKLEYLQKILYHIGNLIHRAKDEEPLTDKEKELIQKTGLSLSAVFRDPLHQIPAEHYVLIDELDHVFRRLNQQQIERESKRYHHHFSAKVVLVYELLALHDVLEDLDHLCDRELKAEQLSPKEEPLHE
ncbi:aromatic acid exporter family protein [Pseudalkalibacillus caeni]|nr:aromatic acid exporter family protein [Pseudalkalibacillus caeni]